MVVAVAVAFAFLRTVDVHVGPGPGDAAFPPFFRVDMGFGHLQGQEFLYRFFRSDLHQGPHQHIPGAAHIAFDV